MGSGDETRGRRREEEGGGGRREGGGRRKEEGGRHTIRGQCILNDPLAHVIHVFVVDLIGPGGQWGRKSEGRGGGRVRGRKEWLCLYIHLSYGEDAGLGTKERGRMGEGLQGNSK